jgi:hypothetical protein
MSDAKLGFWYSDLEWYCKNTNTGKQVSIRSDGSLRSLPHTARSCSRRTPRRFASTCPARPDCNGRLRLPALLAPAHSDSPFIPYRTARLVPPATAASSTCHGSLHRTGAPPSAYHDHLHCANSLCHPRHVALKMCVANVFSRCFRCFKGMLQEFHTDKGRFGCCTCCSGYT